MNKPNKSTMEEEIKQAELNRIRVEIGKIEAEKKRMELLNNELARPWYEKIRSLQTFAAIVVSIPVIWFYVKEIALPVIKSENIELKLKNELIADTLRQKNRDLIAQREKQETDYLDNLSKLEVLYTKNAATLGHLTQSYKNLGDSLELAQSKSDDFKRKYQASFKEQEKQKHELTALKQQIAAERSRLSRAHKPDLISSRGAQPLSIQRNAETFEPEHDLRSKARQLLSQNEGRGILILKTNIPNLTVISARNGRSIPIKGDFFEVESNLKWYALDPFRQILHFKTQYGLQQGAVEIDLSGEDRVLYVEVKKP